MPSNTTGQADNKDNHQLGPARPAHEEASEDEEEVEEEHAQTPEERQKDNEEAIGRILLLEKEPDDYNAVLNVPLDEDTVIEDYVREFRQLAMKIHPDKNRPEMKDKATKAFKIMNQSKKVVQAIHYDHKEKLEQKEKERLRNNNGGKEPKASEYQIIGGIAGIFDDVWNDTRDGLGELQEWHRKAANEEGFKQAVWKLHVDPGDAAAVQTVKVWNDHIEERNRGQNIKKHHGTFDLKVLCLHYHRANLLKRLYEKRLTAAEKEMEKEFDAHRHLKKHDKLYQDWSPEKRQAFENLKLLPKIKQHYKNHAKFSKAFCNDRSYPKRWAWQVGDIDSNYPWNVKPQGMIEPPAHNGNNTKPQAPQMNGNDTKPQTSQMNGNDTQPQPSQMNSNDTKPQPSQMNANDDIHMPDADDHTKPEASQKNGNDDIHMPDAGDYTAELDAETKKLLKPIPYAQTWEGEPILAYHEWGNRGHRCVINQGSETDPQLIMRSGVNCDISVAKLTAWGVPKVMPSCDFLKDHKLKTGRPDIPLLAIDEDAEFESDKRAPFMVVGITYRDGKEPFWVIRSGAERFMGRQKARTKVVKALSTITPRLALEFKEHQIQTKEITLQSQLAWQQKEREKIDNQIKLLPPVRHEAPTTNQQTKFFLPPQYSRRQQPELQKQVPSSVPASTANPTDTDLIRQLVNLLPMLHAMTLDYSNQAQK